MEVPHLILTNGRFTTLDRRQPEAGAVAVTDGQPQPRHPRRPELQHGVVLGWTDEPRRRDAHAEGSGGAHAGAAMDAGNELRHLESVLTVIGGEPVYVAAEFADVAPPAPPGMPDWSCRSIW